MVANQVSREIEMDLRSVPLSHSTLEFGIPSCVHFSGTKEVFRDSNFLAFEIKWEMK